MNYQSIFDTLWAHAQPYVFLAACYLVLLIWKGFWGWLHDRAEAQLKQQESRLTRAELMLADAMLRVEEEEAKALREKADGGITKEEGKQLLEKAVGLAKANVTPLISGVVLDPETWIRNKINAQLAKWKAKLPFGPAPSPTTPTRPEAPPSESPDNDDPDPTTDLDNTPASDGK